MKDETVIAQRAAELLNWMVPPEGPVGSIAPGHLIVLKCDPRVLVLRLAGRDKTYNVEQLSLHIEAINRMWSEQSATIIDTTNLSQSQVVKKVLEIILFRPYKPIDFQQICQSKTIEVAA